jgi:hypothetical protein
MKKNSLECKRFNSRERMSLAMAILEEQISNGIEIKIPFINYSIKKHDNSKEKTPLTRRSS